MCYSGLHILYIYRLQEPTAGYNISSIDNYLSNNHLYPSENHAIVDTASSFRPEILLQPYPAALSNSQTATIQQKLDEVRILAAKFSFPQDARKILE